MAFMGSIVLTMYGIEDACQASGGYCTSEGVVIPHNSTTQFLGSIPFVTNTYCIFTTPFFDGVNAVFLAC